MSESKPCNVMTYDANINIGKIPSNQIIIEQFLTPPPHFYLNSLISTAQVKIFLSNHRATLTR